MDNIKRKPPLNKICEMTSLSPATVSRAFNHPELVKDSTMAAIRSAARTLGWELGAPEPSGLSERTVLLNAPSLQNLFYSEIINGAQSSSTLRGGHLLIRQGQITEATLPDFLDVVRSSGAAGVIILNKSMDADLLRQIDRQVPVIQCCEYNGQSGVPYVSIDDHKAAADVVDYLWSTGRRKIALLNGPLDYKYAQERLRGFTDAMQAHGLEISPSWVMSLPDINFNLGYSAACKVLSQEERPDAIFAVSDIFAIGAIRAAHRFGLRIPEEISIVGFDNLGLSSMLIPSVSTVSQPMYQIGFTASEYLWERIMNPDAHIDSILLGAELIIRESSMIL